MRKGLRRVDVQHERALLDYCYNAPLARLDGLGFVFIGNSLVRGKRPTRPIHPFLRKRRILDRKRDQLDNDLRISGDETSLFLDYGNTTDDNGNSNTIESHGRHGATARSDETDERDSAEKVA